MVASAFGHEEIVEVLLSQDSDGKLLNAKNVFGQSARDLAVMTNREDVIKRLDSAQKGIPASGGYSVTNIDRSFITETVKSISSLVQASESNNLSQMVNSISSVVNAIKKVLELTYESNNPEVAIANQGIIRLLADLVKVVKQENFEEVRPLSVLILNEIKSCLILLQNT